MLAVVTPVSCWVSIWFSYCGEASFSLGFTQISSESWFLVKPHEWRARLISIYSWYDFFLWLCWAPLNVVGTQSAAVTAAEVAPGKDFLKESSLLLLLFNSSFSYSSFLSSSFFCLLGSDVENRNAWNCSLSLSASNTYTLTHTQKIAHFC